MGNPARLGVMRLGDVRLNDYEPWVAVEVHGVDRTGGATPNVGVRIDGATITQVLNDAPDTAQLVAAGFTPVAGQAIRVWSGDRDPVHQLFGGRALAVTARYEEETEHNPIAAFDLEGIDPTWLLGRRKVIGTYVNWTADAIVRDLIAKFARGVTTRNVGTNLPVIDEMSFSNEDLAAAISAVAERAGLSGWFLDYQDDLWFPAEGPAANAITQAAPLGSRGYALREDLSQIITRVIGIGGGANASIDTGAGATELPVDEGIDQTWYAAGGGLVEAGTQVIAYGGVRGRGGLGAFVGAGNAPAGAPVPGPTGGSSHTVGATYKYAASFTTAAGETLPGPLGSITIQNTVIPAPAAVTARSRAPATYPPGMITPSATTIAYKVQIAYVGGAIGPAGAASPTYTWDGFDWELYVGPTAPTGSGSYYPALEPGGAVAPVNWVAIYRSDNGGPFYLAQYVGTYAGNAPGWTGGCAAGYSTSPVLATTGFGSVALTSIPVSSASGVTGRKLYRTVANGSALKLLATIANNSATTYTDTIADGALGAAPPATDTSGVKDEGQVVPGAITLPVSSTTPFSDDLGPPVIIGFQFPGGPPIFATRTRWVRIGNLPVKYTGVDVIAGTLTGIPATGVGSITAPIRYGAQVLLQPSLVGIPASGTGAIVRAIRRGDTVSIRLEVQDDTAALALATRLTAPGGTPVLADGLVEDVIRDARYTLTELNDRALAVLAERKDPHRTVTFESRDQSLQVGRLVAFTLTTPPIAGTFRIQRIAFSEMGLGGLHSTVHPLRRIEASSKLYTFNELLRRLRAGRT